MRLERDERRGGECSASFVHPGIAIALPRLVIRHHFTVDVEEYFQVSALEPQAPRRRWALYESRIVRQGEQLLELLAGPAARATFFVVGWVAERHRGLVRSIAAAGHEIASHTWDHARVTTQTPPQFRRSVRRSKQLLEDITGASVQGFRAPSYSIVPGWEWALDVLLEEGYRYDSSLFPVRRRGYGYPGGKEDPHWLERPAGKLGEAPPRTPRVARMRRPAPGGKEDPHWLERPAGKLVEIPPATLRFAGRGLPAAGGAYFRLLPYSVVRTALRQCERRGVPGTFYIHPWEIDAEQPRFAVSWATRLRHYGGLQGMLPRLERLLTEFPFGSIRDTLAKARLASATAPTPDLLLCPSP